MDNPLQEASYAILAARADLVDRMRQIGDLLATLQSGVQAMTDAELRAAWLRTDGEVGDPVADALAAEMSRRNLDI